MLKLSDVPVADEINWIGPAHTKMRDQTFEAAGVPEGDPDPRLVQERRVRRARRERQPRRTAAAATTAPLLEHPEDARSMTPEQLDDLYKRATVEGGLPDGYGYGYPIVHPDFPVTQVLTDNHWHGKHFEVLSKEGEPERGIVFNYITLLPRDEKAFIQEVPGVMVRAMGSVWGRCVLDMWPPRLTDLSTTTSVHREIQGRLPAARGPRGRRQALHHH